MKHWLKRALATAALASGAMIATAGMASASSESPLPVDPEAIISLTQEATNNNATNQNAQPNAETHQSNVYVPVAVLSKDSNNGKVEQSNEAETTAIAVNENGTKQSIDQDQTAEGRDGCGKCGSEGGSSQSQTAENNNTTNQNAQPNAETHQSNQIGSDQAEASNPTWDKGYESPRDRDGAEQSNEAETTAIAVNENGTKQSIDQDQTAEGRDGCGKCDSEGGSSQSQTAENNNTTNQNAQPNAETHQSNVYVPVAVLSKDSNNGKVEQSNEAETTAIAVNENGTKQSIDQDQTAEGRDGCGKCGSEGGSSQSQTAENNNTTNQNAQPNAETHQSNQIGSDQAEASNPTWDKGYESPHDRDGAEQSNEAETTAIAVNENGTKQSIDQDQTARDKDKDDRDHKDKDDRDHKDKDDRDHKDKDDRDHKDKDDRDHKDKDDRDHKDKDDRDHKDKDDRDHKDKDDRDHKDKDDRDHKEGRSRCAPKDGRSQSQTAGNNNPTNQNARPRAETNQSTTSDRGPEDLDQSNEARTKALAANGNGTGQSISQSQHLSR